jgi:hypothetical protein
MKRARRVYEVMGIDGEPDLVPDPDERMLG